MEVEHPLSLSADIIEKITEHAFKLNSQRKEKKKLKEKAFADFKT